jgi:predicted HAD superfamily Cof-like phosphohydrolase
MTSHYHNVLAFSEAFEVKQYDGKLNEIFDNDSELVKFRIDLIEEEMKELLKAYADKDFIEVIDALCDILYVCYGALIAFNITYFSERNFLSKISSIIELFTSDANLYQCKPYINDSDFISSLSEISKLALYRPSILTTDIFKANCSINHKKMIIWRIKCIDNNVKDLNKQINNKNINNAIAAADRIITTCYNALIAFKVDINAAFDIVHNSNMSKLCSSKKQVDATLEFYKNNGEYDSPTFRESKVIGKYIVYNASTTKVLKNIKYTKVDFTSLFKE